MRKKLPITNFVFYGGLSLFAITMFIISIFTDGRAVPISIMGAVALAFGLLFGIMVYQWYKSCPDYITKHGIAVWTNNISGVHRILLEYAIDVFLEEFPKQYTVATVDLLKQMLKDSAIEWNTTPVSWLSVGWNVRDKAGLQSGKHIKVQYLGDIGKTALFHELAHMVHEIVVGYIIDYRHDQDTQIWKAVDNVTAIYNQRVND
jgi:hypothetical protein